MRRRHTRSTASETTRADAGVCSRTGWPFSMSSRQNMQSFAPNVADHSLFRPGAKMGNLCQAAAESGQVGSFRSVGQGRTCLGCWNDV
jgi:hypothetical protein